jgi:hypothetical protein
MGASELFKATFRGGDCQGHFRHGTGLAASASEAKDHELNKNNIFGARLAPPKPMEVEDVPPIGLNLHSGGILSETEPRAPQAEFLAGLQGLHQC